MEEGGAWAASNKAVRRLRKRLRQITHLKLREGERELTAEERVKIDDEERTRRRLAEEEAHFATLEPPPPPQEPEPDLEPEPEPEPEVQQPAALDRAAHPEDAAQPELAALLGTVLPEVVAPQGAESDGEEAQPGAGVPGDGADAPASNDGTQAETAAAAAAAQKERLAALEARQTASPATDSTAPAPAPKQAAEAPTVPRKPAVSVFARRTSRFSVTVLEGHSDGITGIALLGERGATVVTASFDCTVKWWDSRTGAELKSLGKHKKAIESLSYHHGSGTLATASRDGNVMLWDAEAMAHKRSTYIGTALTDLCFVDQDSTALHLAVGGFDGRLRLLDTEAGKVIGKSDVVHSEKIGAVACGGGADGCSLLASGGADSIVKLWDARTSLSKPPVASLGSEEEMGPVRSLAFSGSDTLLCGDDGNNIKAFDLRHTSRPLQRVRNSAFAHEDAQCALFVSATGQCWPGGGGTVFAAAAELADDEDDDETVEDAKGGTASRTYLSDRLDGCIHVFAPRPSGTWEYRSTLADETGLISSVSVLGSAGMHDEEVMAFGSFDATARVWWPEDRPSAALDEEPIAGFFDTSIADIEDTDLEDNDD